MIQIMLNNVEVFPEKDTSIKITKENPVLTGSGSYTLDVNFPMSNNTNCKFFKGINRIDTRKNYVTYGAEILNNGMPLLKGTAVMTKVTDENVTVQILAGNSNVSFWNNADEQYIDEYELNKEGDTDIVLQWLNSVNAQKLDMRNYGNKFIGPFYQINFWSRESAEQFKGVDGKFTAAPFVDEDKDCDEMLYKCGNVLRGGAKTEDGRYNYVFNFITPHVNLLYLAKKLCEKRGYTADFSLLSDTRAKDIYVGSAIPTTDIATTLPHWTVKEFFTQFCNLFNITLSFNESKMTVIAVDNRTFFNTSKVLKDYEDAIEVSIEEEGDTNLMFSNIAYASSNNKVQNVDKSLREKCPTYLANGYDDVPRAFAEAGNNTWAFYGKGADIMTVDNDTAHSIYGVDTFRPLDRGAENEVELKIIPAKTDQCNAMQFELFNIWYDPEFYDEEEVIENSGSNNPIRVTYYWYKQNGWNKTAYPYQRMLSLENGYGGYWPVSGSLWKELSGEDNDSEYGEKEDYMPVFMISTGKVQMKAAGATLKTYVWFWRKKGADGTLERYNNDTHQDREVTDMETELTNCPASVRIPFTERWIDGWQHPDGYNTNGCDANLCIAGDRTQPFSIYNFHKNCPRFNDKSVLQLRFLSSTPPDVLNKFIIGGKQYACTKVEYDIDSEGIDPLMTGYFVEILT